MNADDGTPAPEDDEEMEDGEEVEEGDEGGLGVEAEDGVAEDAETGDAVEAVEPIAGSGAGEVAQEGVAAGAEQTKEGNTATVPEATPDAPTVVKPAFMAETVEATAMEVDVLEAAPTAEGTSTPAAESTNAPAVAVPTPPTTADVSIPSDSLSTPTEPTIPITHPLPSNAIEISNTAPHTTELGTGDLVGHGGTEIVCGEPIAPVDSTTEVTEDKGMEVDPNQAMDGAATRSGLEPELSKGEELEMDDGLVMGDNEPERKEFVIEGEDKPREVDN